jgi:penicillin-binding protein 2
MQPEKMRVKSFGRRATLLVGGKLALLGVLCGRLYYLQVLESQRYQMLADDNRINLRLLAPPRGHIVDRNGAPLAVNVQNYRVVLVPEQALDVRKTLDRLNTVIEIHKYDRRRVLREAQRRRAFVPITVRENLSWQEVSRIEVNAPDLPGISIDVGQSRHYPNGKMAAHVMGYVAAVSEKDLAGDPLLELPGFRIGKNGVERQYDLALRGTAGNSQVEVNAIGRVIRELKRSEGRPGKRIVLTIDLGLQRFITERVSDYRRAAAIVLNVRNGEILAMVSLPSFDPNAFNEGLSPKAWKKLIENPDTPLNNKAISGQYAPGSTFKLAVMMAAAEAGISPDRRVFCSGFTELGNQRFHCWNHKGHGLINMIDGMRESCDVYFYELALKLGVDRIATTAQKLGLGSKLDLDIPGERGGMIPTKAWKREHLGKSWLKGETLIAAIGQGYVLTTPLQLAIMTARAVNGGYAVMPRLTRKTIDAGDETPTASSFPHTGLSKRSRQLVMQALDEAVNHPRGTAYKSRIQEPRRAFGGKTGTAQVRRITMAERESGVKKNNEKPWRERDHSLFVGYAPVDNPVYSVSVVIEHGGGGSKTAAPIAQDILREAQRLQLPQQLAGAERKK